MCKPDEKGLSDPADGNEGIEKLRSELAALKSRCGKLEAQAYVEVAQQLDLLVQLVTFGLSVASFLLYWNILGWFLTFAVYAGNLLVSPSTGDFLFHTYSIIAFKLASASIPILRHRWYHRIDYRRLEVFAVFGVFIARVKLCRWREALFAPKEGSSSSKDNQFGAVITEEDIWEASYEVNAQFLYASILRLRGLWIKTAQYLSSRADFAPKAYVRHLSKLQDEAPETEWEEVEKMLKRAGILDQFSSVEKKPIASASIGQVHFATLKKTGEKVVVKVQHPQARTLLLDDFWSLTVITRIVSYLEPEWAFLEKLMAEWAKEAHKELSFTSEMEHLLLAKVAIDTLDKDATTSPGTGAMPFKVEIPIPYPELTSRDVLVMSYCEGAKVDDLDQLEKWNLPKGAVMDAVAQAFAHMMYAADIFNGDPHAGNILVRPGLGNTIDSQGGGLTIVLLDWGLAKQLPQEKRIALCKLCLAAATFDFGMLLDSFKAMGLKMKREDVAEDMEGIRFLLRDMAPREQQMKRIKAKIRTDRGRMDKRAKGEKIPMDSKTYPGELFFFIRVNELLNGLGSKLAIDLAYMELVKPYAERGITQSIPPSTRSESKAEDSEHIDAELSTLLSSETKLLEDEEKIAGVQVCVVDSEGRVIANHSRGHMGGVHRSLTMTPEAAILGYSCTKAITATVAHIMIEEGYLSLDEPICERVWTAFCPTEEVPLELKELGMDQKWQWKRQVTLRHILTHTAGFSSAFPKGLSIKSMASCETCIEAFRYDPSHPEDTLLPDDEPGKTCTYHSMSFGWLCAGVLRGAYAVRHAGSDDITYEQVYNTILKSRLSDATLLSGFFPCGIKLDNSKPTLALTEADVSMSRMTQLNREKQSMGETLEDSEEALSERKRLEAVLGTFRGREFLLDPRIWNCEVILEANVPAAGGRFSAKGLAHFYHELGSGKILSKDHLAVCTSPSATESSLGALQGQTVMSSSPKDSNQQESSSFGLGYQLIKMKDGDTKSAFGHAGVGGSIGFHHKESGMSVAVMLNKADGDRDTATRLVRKISDHFDWE